MKNQAKTIINFSIAGFSGILIPVFLLIAIPMFFKAELKSIETLQPIILKMTSLNIHQTEPVKKEKTARTEKMKMDKKPKPINKVAKKTKLAKAEPVIKESPEKVIQKPIEKIEEIFQNEFVSENSPKSAMPIPEPVFKLTEAPQFLHREKLVYPENMRSSGITGNVKLAVLIDKKGIVHRVKVLESAGEYFDNAAKKALLASTFIPAKIGNKKVAVELRMPIRFRLL